MTMWALLIHEDGEGDEVHELNASYVDYSG